MKSYDEKISTLARQKYEISQKGRQDLEKTNK